MAEFPGIVGSGPPRAYSRERFGSEVESLLARGMTDEKNPPSGFDSIVDHVLCSLGIFPSLDMRSYSRYCVERSKCRQHAMNAKLAWNLVWRWKAAQARAIRPDDPYRGRRQMWRCCGVLCHPRNWKGVLAWVPCQTACHEY